MPRLGFRSLSLLSLLCAASLLSFGCSSDSGGGDSQGDDEASADDDADDDDDDDSEQRDAAASPPKNDAGALDAAPGSTVDASNTRDARAETMRDASGSTAPKDASEPGPTPSDGGPSEKFSFFVTSLKAMVALSKSQHGFGGDLRFGETGEGAGLRGADKICTTIAEMSMPGSGAKGWRAFLSTVAGGPDGGPVHAVDRIGEGPWYDRLGRLLAMNKSDLIQTRPTNAHASIKNDFPNEDGVPNHNPDGTGEVDNHDFLTGSNEQGKLYRSDPRVTCNDWTKSTPDRNDAPRVGHSWPRTFGGRPGGGGRPFPGSDGGMSTFNTEHWISALDEAGCGPGVFLMEMGPPMESNPTVGSGGGYGGIYCFALKP